MRLRIIKRGTKYIPQVKAHMFFPWGSLSKSSSCTWYDWDSVIRYCLFDTLDEAKSAFETHCIEQRVVWEGVCEHV